MFNPSGCSDADVDLETGRPPANLEQRFFNAFPVLRND
jgi:hypothetical protein